MKEFLPKSAAIRDYTLDEFNLDYICNGRQAVPRNRFKFMRNPPLSNG